MGLNRWPLTWEMDLLTWVNALVPSNSIFNPIRFLSVGYLKTKLCDMRQPSRTQDTTTCQTATPEMLWHVDTDILLFCRRKDFFRAATMTAIAYLFFWAGFECSVGFMVILLFLPAENKVVTYYKDQIVCL